MHIIETMPTRVLVRSILLEICAIRSKYKRTKEQLDWIPISSRKGRALSRTTRRHKTTFRRSYATVHILLAVPIAVGKLQFVFSVEPTLLAELVLLHERTRYLYGIGSAARSNRRARCASISGRRLCESGSI